MSDARKGDYEAELLVLAGMTQNGQTILEVAEILGPDDFAAEPHQDIFGAIMALYSAGEPVTASTLRAWMSRNRLLFDPEFVADLFRLSAPAGQIGAHARIIWESASRRRIDSMADQLSRMARQPDLSVPDVIAAAQQLLDKMASGASVSAPGAVLLDDFLAIATRGTGRSRASS